MDFQYNPTRENNAQGGRPQGPAGPPPRSQEPAGIAGRPGPDLYVSSTIARDDTYTYDEDEGKTLLLAMGERIGHQSRFSAGMSGERVVGEHERIAQSLPPSPSLPLGRPDASESSGQVSQRTSISSIRDSIHDTQSLPLELMSAEHMRWRQERRESKALLQKDEVAESNSVVSSHPSHISRSHASEGLIFPEASFSSPRESIQEFQPRQGKPESASSQKPTLLSTNDADSSDQNQHKKKDENLASALAAISERFLGLDPMNQSQGATLFIGHLLDTIQMLENKLSFIQAGLKKQPLPLPMEPEGSQTRPPRGQVLHRIFCTNSFHAHDGTIYANEPSYHVANNTRDRRLVSDDRVYNLDTFCRHYPEVSFIIFREHFCLQDDTQRATIQKERRTIGFRAASARGERMRIVSEVLNTALNRVAKFERTFQPLSSHARSYNSTDDKGEMEAPYNFLFHHRRRLSDLAKKEPYFYTVVEVLLSHIDQEYGKEYAEAEAMFERGRVSTQHIEKLFRPHDIAVEDDKRNRVFEAVVLDDYAKITPAGISLTGWNWDYNGRALTRWDFMKSINALVGDEEILITDLTIYPIKFATDRNVRALEERGRRFWDMRGQVYVSYTGRDSDDKYDFVGERFMIDVSTYHLMFSGFSSGAFGGIKSRNRSKGGYRESKYDTRPHEIKINEELPPELAILLPMDIAGFSFQRKTWHLLRIEQVSTVSWNKRAFEQLVLDDHTKEMIYSLVDVQKSVEKMNDIIRGKGNGLIILLHGSPGTGKTLTAESVAEIAEKPLYRVTCGDIGTDAQAVETYLKTVLHLGKVWDCVLLLDEADVFLEERTMADLQRNSLVSVFLRVLEYYEGILILTSNRVGTFDEAFKSRIQVAIHYQDLTRKSRKAIWSNFIDMLESSPQENANIAELERRLDELAAEEMNGRQIRNALLTARQLAKHRDEVLDWQHLSQVIRTSAAFNKYIKTVKGHSDQQWAREEMLR